MGESRHMKHLSDKSSKNSDNDAPFRNGKIVKCIFYCLITLAGFLTYVTTSVTDMMIQVITSIFTVVLIGLAFAVLNKGDSMKTRDKIDSIERKLDKILEHRDDVFQNK